MKLQQLYSYTRKAIDHYQLIESGDKIAIGISGGKDSLTLLYALSGLRRFYPQKFDLVAVTVDLGYENFDLTAVSNKGKFTKVSTVKNAKKTTFLDKKVSSKKMYYYKVRAYKTVKGKKIYGAYSVVKKVKCK